ncbi:MAG: hypothetical protein JST80_12190 [Bdellovibrionales bacterium]|nr:hypothetical protein [Bdellovibrionales bacterium]
MRKILFVVVFVIVACTRNVPIGRMPASLSHDEVVAGTKELIRRAERTKIDYGEYRKAAIDFKNCYATIGPEAGKYEIYVARTREPVGVVGKLLVERTKEVKPLNFEDELHEALKKCN